MLTNKESVYLVYDNTVDLVLTSNDKPVNLTDVTRMTIAFGDLTIDSTSSSDVFDWSEGDGKLSLALGQEAIPVANYLARLIVYDSSNTNGIVWGNVPIRVKE